MNRSVAAALILLLLVLCVGTVVIDSTAVRTVLDLILILAAGLIGSRVHRS